MYSKINCSLSHTHMHACMAASTNYGPWIEDHNCLHSGSDLYIFAHSGQVPPPPWTYLRCKGFSNYVCLPLVIACGSRFHGCFPSGLSVLPDCVSNSAVPWFLPHLFLTSSHAPSHKRQTVDNSLWGFLILHLSPLSCLRVISGSSEQSQNFSCVKTDYLGWAAF